MRKKGDVEGLKLAIKGVYDLSEVNAAEAGEVQKFF